MSTSQDDISVTMQHVKTHRLLSAENGAADPWCIPGHLCFPALNIVLDEGRSVGQSG